MLTECSYRIDRCTDLPPIVVPLSMLELPAYPLFHASANVKAKRH